MSVRVHWGFVEMASRWYLPCKKRAGYGLQLISRNLHPHQALGDDNKHIRNPAGPGWWLCHRLLFSTKDWEQLIAKSHVPHVRSMTPQQPLLAAPGTTVSLVRVSFIPFAVETYGPGTAI